MKPNRFARYAWGVLAYNLLVVLWGALVRATGSGAGCGSHWPLCNGQVIPRPEQLETVIELTHRLTSGLALLSVVVLLVWARRSYPAGHRVRLGATLSMVLMVLEALLGAGLVLFELVAYNPSMLRAFSMVAHLVNTFLLIGALAITAWWAAGGAEVWVRGQGRVARLLGVGFAGMLLVGATGAIAALGDTLFPARTLTEGLRDSFSPESHPLVRLRKLHPFLAIGLGAYLVAVAHHVAHVRAGAEVRRLAQAVTALYATQLLAGTVNVVLLAPVWMQLLHLLLADLLWIALVLLAAAALAGNAERPGGRAGGERVGAVAG